MIASMLLGAFLLPVFSTGQLPEPYQKWLDEEVRYIISSREKDEFQQLETDALRDAFIERFWRRRDPDLATDINEFRDEHFRRIAYASERFDKEGRPGWRTQRGRVYIIHGPPDDIRYSYGRQMRAVVYNPTPILNPTGSNVPLVEVEIQVPESETWTYYHLPGIRSSRSYFTVIFAKMDSEPLLAVERYVKRVAPNASGPQRAQRDAAIKGFVTRPGLYSRNDYRIIYAGDPRFVDAEDYIANSFQPYTPAVDQFILNQVRADLERSSGEVLEEKLRREEKLRTLVESRVFFGELPLEVGVGFLKFLQGRVHVPLRVRISVPEEEPTQAIELMAELSRPGGGRTVAVLTDELRGTRRQPLSGEVSYQNRLVAPPGDYQLRVTASDEVNQRLGLWERKVTVPDLSGTEFGASELVLCDEVIPHQEFKNQKSKAAKRAAHQSTREALLTFDENVFVPAVEPIFRRRQNLTALLEVYNPSLESGVPQVRIRSSFQREHAASFDFPARRLDYLTDASGKTIIYAFTVPLRELDPGNYQFSVEVTDSPTGQVVQKSVALSIR